MDHRGDDYAASTANRSGLDPASVCSRSAPQPRPDPLNLNAITRLQALGQSVWLDASSPGAPDFQRLQQLIDQDGISGIVCGSVHALGNGKHDKSAAGPRPGAALSARPGKAPCTDCRLSAQDAQAAADLLRTRYVLTGGHDGLVSVDVPSDLEGDSKQIVDDARRLWVAIARRNILVSIPGSKANLPAIRELVTAGLNIRVTTLYSGEQYSDAFDAYCAGLEARLAKGYPIWHIAFVVNFAVTALDRRINAAIQNLSAFASPCATSASSLGGEGGIAYATVLHRRAITYAASERFAALAKEGAQPPRLMWALGSDGDTNQEIGKYVEALVRVGTVCSMPLAAIESYRGQDVSGEDRKPIPLEQAFGTAMGMVIGLQKAGVDVGALARQLHAQDNIRHRLPPPERFGARGDEVAGPSMHKPPCRYDVRGLTCAYE